MAECEVNKSIQQVQETEDNPFSVDEIEPRLYLGNATSAASLKFLKSRHITHILTIDSFPLPAHITNNAGIQNKYIHIADMSRENIMEHFTDCIEFIESCLESGEENATNSILIHCFYGVSRSATIVIAYLMKKYSIGYRKAFERAKSKRILVQPNHGFILQLKLFERMGFKIDPTYKNYRIFRLKLAAEQVKSAKILPSSFMNLLAADPGLMQVHPEPHVYRCRKCRRLLASKSNLITHKPKDVHGISATLDGSSSSTHGSPLARQRSTLETSEIERNPIDEIAEKVLEATLNEKPHKDQQPICTKTFFVEPIAWMKDITYNVEGKLYCPSCKAKIGNFNWTMASKCPCGAQVSPSFYFIPSKVEYSNIVQNMKQVTV